MHISPVIRRASQTSIALYPAVTVISENQNKYGTNVFFEWLLKGLNKLGNLGQVFSNLTVPRNLRKSGLGSDSPHKLPAGA